jgi:hypothetical protein
LLNHLAGNLSGAYRKKLRLNLIGVLDLKDGNIHLDTAKQSAKREADV